MDMKTKTLNDGRVFPIELPTIGNRKFFKLVKACGLFPWLKELMKAEGAPVEGPCRVWEEGANDILSEKDDRFSLENRCSLAPSVEHHPLAWISIFDSTDCDGDVGGTIACAGTCKNDADEMCRVTDWQAADVGACCTAFFDRVTGKYIDSIDA